MTEDSGIASIAGDAFNKWLREQSLSEEQQRRISQINEGMDYLHLIMKSGKDSPEAKAFLAEHLDVEENVELAKSALAMTLDWIEIKSAILEFQESPEGAEFEAAAEEVAQKIRAGKREEVLQKITEALWQRGAVLGLASKQK